MNGIPATVIRCYDRRVADRCLSRGRIMRHNISKITVLICCLTLAFQSSGMASLILRCGCFSPWGECCCTSPAGTDENACCCSSVTSTAAACCETQQNSQESSESGCPCWQGEIEQVIALPSSSRFSLQPDSTYLLGADVVPAPSPAMVGGRSLSQDRVPVAPRFRLQSLLCVWVI